MSLPKNDETALLFKAILALKDEDECYNFFDDLCTVQEIRAMAQRIEVAKLLYEGGSYQHATELTGVSSATVVRVNRCLKYGADGYRTVLDRLGFTAKPEK